MKGDQVYVRHMIDAIDQIAEYCKGVSYDAFARNPLLIDGVVRQLQIIGEAAKRLPDGLRARYPDTPWQQIMSMRNKIIHDYVDIDLEVVWKTCQDDLPPLRRVLFLALSE